MDNILIKDYTRQYHFYIEADGLDYYVTIWHWKPWSLDAGGEQRAGQWGSGLSVEAHRGIGKFKSSSRQYTLQSGKHALMTWVGSP